MSPAPAPQTCLPTGKTCLPCLPAGKATGKSASASQRSLTKRDIAILQDLSALRFATAKDISLLQFTPHSLTYARERASCLAGQGDRKEGEYLYRFLPPRTTSASGNTERAYALGSKGARALVEMTGIPVYWYCLPSKLKAVSFSFLRHALLLTRIVAALTYFVRTHSHYTLTDCRLFYELARMQMPPTGENNEKPQTLPVVPDAWLHLERSDGQGTALWIEADCGTEMQRKYKAYLQAKIAFLQSGGYARVFGTPAVLLCFLTTGHNEDYKDVRRRALQRWTQEVLAERKLEDWADVFRFAAVGYQELFTSPLVDAAIWYRADSRTPVPLLTGGPQPPQGEAHEHDDTSQCSETH